MGEGDSRKEFLMLRIYPVILDFVADVYPFIERIGRHDPVVRLSFPSQRAG